MCSLFTFMYSIYKIGAKFAKRGIKTQARTADQRPHRVRFFKTERRRAGLHPHRRLLDDVVPEAHLEEPGLQPPLYPGPGRTMKFNCIY
jgi:hypothetical protein